MLYTAESVSPRHPDKICDQISDLILDKYLEIDPEARVAVETLGGHGQIYIVGEITSKEKIETDALIRDIVEKFPELVRYDYTFNLVNQSPFIKQGVDAGGAGDQGIMIGYACNSNDEFIPQEYYLARKIAREIYKSYPHDGKTQVTIDERGTVQAIVASFQNVEAKKLANIIVDKFPNAKKVLVNPAGDWSQGGFDADTGLTGRKIAIDNYGPRIPIGGGAFSGKDGTKVDRSAAYMARRIAVDYVQKLNAKEVLVKLAYSIGVAKPVMAVAIVEGQEYHIDNYDLSPKGIIDFLELKKPQYFNAAGWGHMGNNFNWK